MSALKTVASRRALLGGLGAAAAVLAAPAVLRAAPRELLINSWLPPQHLIPSLVLTEWAQIIERRTKGAVTFRIAEKPLGPPPATYGMVAGGKCDVGFALHGFSGDDAFQRAKLGQFSFLGDSYSATQAYAEVYWDLLDPREEHKEIKLLSSFQHGPGQLFLRGKSINGPEDFKGLRIRTSGGYISKLLQELGAETVIMPPQAVREAMLAGKVDGGTYSYEGGLSFGLVDVTTEVSEIPGGYYNATWFLGMAPATWDSLDRRTRRVIEQVSREFVPLLAGKSFDFVDHKGYTLFSDRGVKINPAPLSVRSAVRDTGARYEAAWAESLSGAGYDGRNALRRMRMKTGVQHG